MFEQEQRKLLNDAASKFPEGCQCEDCGECPYCSFIMKHLNDWSLNSNVGIRKSLGDSVYEKVHFDIPIGDAEQVYELKRMFRCQC